MVWPTARSVGRPIWASTAILVVIARCTKPPASPQDELISRGRDLFFNETFGNGRTC